MSSRTAREAKGKESPECFVFCKHLAATKQPALFYLPSPLIFICNICYILSNRLGNADVSTASRKEALLVRAEALLLDFDYDEAVQDFRAAFDLVPDDDQTGEKRELHQKLQQTMHQQEMWNGGKKIIGSTKTRGIPMGCHRNVIMLRYYNSLLI